MTVCPIYIQVCHVLVPVVCMWAVSADVCQVCRACAEVCREQCACVCRVPTRARSQRCVPLCACVCHACVCAPCMSRLRLPAWSAFTPNGHPLCPAVPAPPVWVREPERGAGERGSAGGGARRRGREAVPAPTDLQTFINSAAPAAAVPGLPRHRYQRRQRAGRGGAAPPWAHPVRQETPGGGMDTVRAHLRWHRVLDPFGSCENAGAGWRESGVCVLVRGGKRRGAPGRRGRSHRDRHGERHR